MVKLNRRDKLARLNREYESIVPNKRGKRKGPYNSSHLDFNEWYARAQDLFQRLSQFTNSKDPQVLRRIKTLEQFLTIADPSNKLDLLPYSDTTERYDIVVAQAKKTGLVNNRQLENLFGSLVAQYHLRQAELTPFITGEGPHKYKANAEAAIAAGLLTQEEYQNLVDQYYLRQKELTYRELTLTLDSTADELLEGYDGFQSRMHLRTAPKDDQPHGTTRGNVLFDEDFQTVRLDIYERKGVTVIDVSADGTVKYHFESYANNKRLGALEKDHKPDVIDGVGKADLSTVFEVTRKVANSLKAGKPCDYRLPEEDHYSLLELMNDPNTRTSYFFLLNSPNKKFSE